MWCHFSQRVERTATHRLMLARGKGRTYQDERFSYVAIQKLPRDQAEELAESKALRILEEENNADVDAFSALKVSHLRTTIITRTMTKKRKKKTTKAKKTRTKIPLYSTNPPNLKLVPSLWPPNLYGLESSVH